MNIEPRPLTTLTVGEVGVIYRILPMGGLERRLFDLGCVTGQKIKKLGSAPFGSLDAYEILETVIAIRKKDAGKLLITPENGGEIS